MGIAIINLGSRQDRNAATVKDYTALYHALEGASSRFMVINGGGEMVGPSQYAAYDPHRVALMIAQHGIWVDYCGFPMFYQGTESGTVTTLGQTGWHEFVEYLGFGWLRNQQFDYPGEYTLKAQYPFRRGFPLSQSLVGVCYDANGVFSQPSGFLGIGGGQFPLTADGFTAMVALHKPGGGYYFYGAYRYSADAVIASAIDGVPINTYAAFIRNVLAGNVSQYACLPYKLSTEPVNTVSPGPTSPISVGSSHTAHTAHTSHTAKTVATTSTSNTHVVEEVIAGTLIAGGLGLGAVLYARHKRR